MNDKQYIGHFSTYNTINAYRGVKLTWGADGFNIVAKNTLLCNKLIDGTCKNVTKMLNLFGFDAFKFFHSATVDKNRVFI